MFTKNKNNKQKGISIFGVLVFGVIFVLIISYFNINIKSVVDSPSGQENINYIGGGAKNLWVTYLAKPALYFWNDICVNIFWKSFISNMERIRDGKPTDFEKAGNNLQLQE